MLHASRLVQTSAQHNHPELTATCLINDEECAVPNCFPGERAAEAPEYAPSALCFDEVSDAFHRPRKATERRVQAHLHAALHGRWGQSVLMSAPIENRMPMMSCHPQLECLGGRQQACLP